MYKPTPGWKRYVNSLTSDERYKILCVAIERLLEIEEFSFIQEDEDCEECLIWPGSGENILKDK